MRRAPRGHNRVIDSRVSRLVALAAWGAVLAPGCLDPATRTPRGPLCSDGSECDEGFDCVYGRCRPDCTIDRDCPEGTTCEEAPGGGGVCMEPVLFADDFGDGEADGWTLWRTEFAVVEGQLWVQDSIREGFEYGHDGHGRSGTAYAHLGDESWTDYRLELDVESTHLGTFWGPATSDCYAGFGVYFRAEEDSEDWNQPARTNYQVGFSTRDCTDPLYPRGYFGISRIHDWWMDTEVGWDPYAEQGSSRLILEGIRDDVVVDGPNHVEVEVVGQHVRLRVNDVEVASVDDTEYDEGQEPITFGGVGVYWGWESLGWLDNVVVTRMPPPEE